MWCRPPSTTPCHPPTIYLQDSLVLIFGINYTIQLQLISYVNTSNKSKDILVSCSWNYCQIVKLLVLAFTKMVLSLVNQIASVSRHFLDPWSLLSPPAHVLSSSPGSQDSIEWWTISVGGVRPNLWLFLEDKVKYWKSEKCWNILDFGQKEISRMFINPHSLH